MTPLVRSIFFLLLTKSYIDVETEYKEKMIFLLFVYGEPNQHFRDQVRERLTRLEISRDEPWSIISELNEITGNHEKQGGALKYAYKFL